MSSQRGWGNLREVRGQVERRLNIFGRLNPCRPKRGWRKIHEPVVVHIDRRRDVRFPLMRLVEIYGHILNSTLPRLIANSPDADSWRVGSRGMVRG